ncbi:alpha/beta-hydrolase [Artomyces pyxidatus]|uniref:Alpha/beta-hydrolase n=1 Tax=Artomyces pyxidatus TaxID=48021 RepID=A0ACB8SV65_9AGAM|nr:alpha/beta-hydrolase [Artomyces pyxidatus]
MPHFPLLSRLRGHEFLALFFGFLFVLFEGVLHVVILALPKPVIHWFYVRSRTLFHRFVGVPEPKSRLADRIRRAADFEELCRIFGYFNEEHVVLTKDGYLLGIHRLPGKKGEATPRPGTSTGKPVVYLHHGLLMNSEIWVCLTEAERSLPFVLAEQGFDVWLGNNRGNKYSKKSIHHDPNGTKFWDYSMDDFAWHDIPDAIEYVLQITRAQSLSYVGFSQGTAQAFAALSIHPQLNAKVNVFIALAPAMSPAGLAAPLVDGLMKASPNLLFLVFGRRAILSSAIMWQQILYPPIFSRLIDASLTFLFSWRSRNISPTQKLAAYAHLYSFASTKSVVHWFQIMRTGRFLMYDDDPYVRSVRSGYRPAAFPTRNIATNVVLLYGDSDSLVDIATMRHELPAHRVTARALRGYEHLDVLWGENVHIDVIPEVVRALREHCSTPEILGMEGERDLGIRDFF